MIYFDHKWLVLELEWSKQLVVAGEIVACDVINLNTTYLFMVPEC